MSIQRQSWADFQDSGLLWWVNRILHTFGWSIIFTIEEDGTISDVYPARTTWLGFDGETNEKNLDKFREHLK